MSEPSHPPSLSLRDIRRSFAQPTGALEVLKGCEAEISPGDAGRDGGHLGQREVNAAADLRLVG